MCNRNGVTAFKGGPIQIVGTLPVPGSPGAVQPLTPFAAVRYPTVSTPDDKFKAALTTALGAQAAAGRFGSGSRIAFSMIALASNGNHKYAGNDPVDEEMHFSASLVKVAAMFAAHELLAAARRLAKRKGFADAAAFRSALATEFNPAISTKTVASIRTLTVNPALMEHAPKYDLIFDVQNTGVANVPVIEFTNAFRDDLVSMIGHGTNDGASRVIRKVSYDYINAALIAGGFFDPPRPPAAQNGIWLAGDYLGDKNKPKFNNAAHIPYVRIDCVNDCFTSGGVTDCGVAQISTTRRMSNLFALIELGKCPAADPIQVMDTDLGQMIPDSCSKMKGLLAEPKPIIPNSGGQRDVPWLDQSRLLGVTARFSVTRDKIGVASKKPDDPPGPSVHSEGLIVKWNNAAGDAARLATRNLTGTIAISWQNLVGPPPGKDFDGIARVVNDAFAAYIATPP
jgi:hypothetical protein